MEQDALSKKVGEQNVEDDFLERLKIKQNYVEQFPVKKRITAVPIKTPSNQDWIQVKQEEGWSCQVWVLTIKETRDRYVVDPQLCQELAGEIQPMVLCTYINRQGNLFLWPIRLPSGDGRRDNWAISAMEAAKTPGWFRIKANMSLGGYDVYQAIADIPDPDWPDISFGEIVRIAFKDNLIEDADHPVIKNLMGRA